MMRKTMIEEERIYYSLSFDIGGTDNGRYWLQIYDDRKRLLYDEPFASAYGDISTSKILKTIKDELPFIKRAPI